MVTLPDGDEAPPRTSRIDRRWWTAPAATIVALAIAGPVELMFLGLSAMATDNCSPDTPCPPGDDVRQVYTFAMTATAVGFVLTIALPWRSLRPVRWMAAGATVLCSLYPVLWMLSGNPRL